MNNTELRIGNNILVNYKSLARPSSDIKQIESIVLGIIDDVIYTEHAGVPNINSIYPIPLTFEWLKKFEFKMEDSGNNVTDFWRTTSAGIEISIVYYGDEYLQTEINSIGIDIHILYVHQLQNLYFALTGEELECKIK